MLKVGELLDEITGADNSVGEDTAKLEVVVKDYDGDSHNVSFDGCYYLEGRMVLELHSEIEDDDE